MTDTPSRPRDASPARDIAVPPDVRALSALPRIDYENGLVIESGTAADRTAEQWVRAIIKGAPADTRDALTSGWSRLGMRLVSDPTDRHVLGWPVRHSSPDVALLGTGSDLGLECELLVRRAPGTLLFASFVQQETDDARTAWAQMADIHPRVMRQLLEAAVDRATA